MTVNWNVLCHSLVIIAMVFLVTDGEIQDEKMPGNDELKAHSASHVSENITSKILKCGFHEEARLCTKKRCQRFAFYAKKWPFREITYRIDNLPSKSNIRNKDIPQLFKEAFQLWSDVSPLVFREVGKNEIANTVIKFEKGYHENDDAPFDGPRGFLAHAYHLMGGYGDLNGDIHFDDDENWTWKSTKDTINDKVNLFIVAAHEMGHVIGLGHSDVRTALMWENYQEFRDGYTLSEDDIAGIQHIYGKNEKKDQTVKTGSVKNEKTQNEKKEDKLTGNEKSLTGHSKTKNRLPSNKCDWSLGGVTVYRGEIMIFKGNRIWRMKDDGTIISSEDGELAASYWYRLPSDIEAVYQRNTDNALIFIKGRYLYVYKGPHQYPLIEARPLQKEMPDGVDAAFTVESKSNTAGLYLFKKKKVWKVDMETYKIETGYPKKLSSVWKKLPRDIYAAFYNKGFYYFFRNRRVYKSKSGKNNKVSRYQSKYWQTIFKYTKTC